MLARGHQAFAPVGFFCRGIRSEGSGRFTPEKKVLAASSGLFVGSLMTLVAGRPRGRFGFSVMSASPVFGSIRQPDSIIPRLRRLIENPGRQAGRDPLEWRYG